MARSGSVIVETEVSTRTFPLLDGHRIYGRVVVPAAFYIAN